MGRFLSPTARRFSLLTNFNHNLISPCNKQQCLSLLNDCSSMKQLNQIHAHLHISGLQTDSQLVTEILRICTLSPFGNLDYAQTLLYRSFDPLPTSWNNLIRGYSTSNSPRNSILVFVEMRNRGIRPIDFTFPFLLKACAKISALKEGKQIQVEIVKSGFDFNVYIQSTLIHFYGSCKQIHDARKVFDLMSLRNVVSWNAIITACVENSVLDESIMLFARMRVSGFEPDEGTMVLLLSACAELGNLSLGKCVHCQVIEKGLAISCRLGTALLDMYAKCGAVDRAQSLFDRMPVKNVWTWSAMIMGLARHGFANDALKLFTVMKTSSIRPNYVTFLGVLCACSHSGLVEDGYKFFHEMVDVYRIQPITPHYGAMVDILCRSGKLLEAYSFISNMPIEPYPIVLRTLLSACKIHDASGTSGVAEKALKMLMELEPRRSGNLVMVANMYAVVGLWDKARSVRKVMREGGLKKTAGESCIEIGGSVHKFLSGDDVLLDYAEIYPLLDELNLHMK